MLKKKGIISAANIRGKKHTDNLLREKEKILTHTQKMAKIDNWVWGVRRNTFRTVLERIPDLIFFLNTRGNIEYINRHVSNINQKTITDTHVLSLRYFPQEFHGKFQQALQTALNQGLPQEFEINQIDANELVSWQKIRLMPLKRQTAIIGVVGMVLDISRQKATEEALRESQQHYSLAQRVAKMGSWEWHIPTNIMYCSETLEAFFGLRHHDFSGSYQTFLDLIYSDDRAKVALVVNGALRGDKDFSTEFRVKWPDGSCHWLTTMGEVIRESNGNPVRILATVQEVTQQKETEKLVLRLSSALEQTADAVVITNIEGIIEYVNPAFGKMTGYHESAALGKTPAILRSGKQDTLFYKKLWDTIKNGEVFQDVVINKRKSGDIYYEEKTITPLRDQEGNITHFISTGKDITDRMMTQERLQYLAHHDILTHLPNRFLFIEHLNHALLRSQRDNCKKLAVLFLDLDRFKNINDSFGHAAGDAALKIVADRLRKCLRTEDILARLGGDEFTILLTHLGDTEEIMGIVRRIHQALRLPLEVENREFYLSTSIGICIYPDDGQDAATLLRNADVAMYQAKEEGKDTYHFYSADLSNKAMQRLTMETQLRRAVEKEEFVIYYQPLYDLFTSQVVALEALVRWQHPTEGLLCPERFIHIAEDTGVITAIDAWVLSQVCHKLKYWHQVLKTTISVTINLSNRQINNPLLMRQLQKALQDNQVDPRYLELEITENAIMKNPKETIATLQHLKKLGIKLAVDDFGTGYSSLNYLKRLPIDILKIDQSFVRDITSDVHDAAIVKAIISLAQHFQLQVVAEGVETHAQATFLLNHGCRIAQGYLFCKPLPVDQLERFLKIRPVELELSSLA